MKLRSRAKDSPGSAKVPSEPDSGFSGQLRSFLLFAAIAIAGALAFSAAGSGIDSQVARAQEGLGAPPPVESVGTPGTADNSAVLDLKKLARHEAISPKKSVVHHTHKPFPNPHRLATSVEKNPTADYGLSDLVSQTAMASPATSANFLALPDNGTVIPPDTQGTVGPNDLMVTLNSQVRVQDKSGNALSTVGLTSFWSSLAGVNEAFDPRVVYDPFNNRWIFSAGGNPESSTAAILIGVSQTSDPTGRWNLYEVRADATGTLWADFPTLGFNGTWIVVQANMFTVSGNAYDHSNIWAFNKADLYAGGAGTYTLLPSSSGFTQYPAVTYDNSIQTEY